MLSSNNKSENAKNKNNSIHSNIKKLKKENGFVLDLINQNNSVNKERSLSPPNDNASWTSSNSSSSSLSILHFEPKLSLNDCLVCTLFAEHTWSIQNFSIFQKTKINLINKEKTAIVLHSNIFPPNKNENKLSKTNSIVFGLRLVLESNDKKENCISLFLHLKNLFLNNVDAIVKTQQNTNNIDIKYEFLITNSSEKTIFKTQPINQTFYQNNCFGIENFIKVEDVLAKLKLNEHQFKSKDDDTINIHCKVYLNKTKNKQLFEMVDFLQTKSETITTASFFSKRFAEEVIIENFTTKFIIDKNPIIKSEYFFSPEKDIKFCLIMQKNDSSTVNNDENNFFSLYIAYSSETLAIYDIFWRVSLLSVHKQPFITGEGKGKLVSEKQMLGSPQFIKEKTLLDIKNGLITNRNLIFFVEIDAAIDKK